MINQPAPSTDSLPAATYADDPAARAFNDLRAEVSVMRRALEAMPQALEVNQPPDYARDIAQVKQAVDALTTRMASLEKKPALSMTPAAYAREIEWAGQATTEEVRTRLKQAERHFAEQTTLLEQWVLGARTAESQSRWLFGMAVVSFICGVAVTLAVMGLLI
tara:strand:+ start:233 stop:721 length:489 start_codon:yes stop_codon:yes gene_type:complete